MRVDLIQKYKDQFSSYLQALVLKNELYEPGYKWDIIEKWQEHFNVDAAKLDQAFANSLESPYSGRLWGGEKHSAKSGMLMLLRENPILMRIAFSDLFDETKDISMRMNRFIFHCDEALLDLSARDKRINTHYQNHYTASLYLSLEYPDKYGLSEYESFYKFMGLIGSRNIPLEQDKERFYKSLNALYIVISKDQEFINGFQFLLKDREYVGKSLFMINDFIKYSLGEAFS